MISANVMCPKMSCAAIEMTSKINSYPYMGWGYILSDFINLTQVHNFTVSAQDIFTFLRLSVFTVSFTRLLQVLMQIMKRFALYY